VSRWAPAMRSTGGLVSAVFDPHFWSRRGRHKLPFATGQGVGAFPTAARLGGLWVAFWGFGRGLYCWCWGASALFFAAGAQAVLAEDQDLDPPRKSPRTSGMEMGQSAKSLIVVGHTPRNVQ